ncbi:unnamed protein product [Didymodactylos carnosus]|nr:unnamed protein product [Didymodactylos carnosus]CAF3828014.1 unnamed protein product [Didymodactylos carnosus]
MEYTSPTNRVVISYPDDQLTVLSIRCHSTTETFFGTKLRKFLESQNDKYDEILKHLVPYEGLHSLNLNHNIFLTDVRNEESGEGYVVEIIMDENNSYLVKVKNLRYLTLHTTKNNISNSRRLFESVINESSDDLKSMFSLDPDSIDIIVKMEEYVKPRYNHLIETVEQFYTENKDLSRKEYALKAQKSHSKYMGLLIALYLGKTNNYKEFAIRHSKDLFGINEQTQTTNNNNEDE